MWKLGTSIHPAMPEVKIVKPRAFHDRRGAHFSYEEIEEGIIAGHRYVNVSHSHSGVLRGLHAQNPQQAKIVTCQAGEIFDVAVDARPGSPTCGKWVGVWLDASTRGMVYIPKGFLHGFYVTSVEHAVVQYFVDEPFNPDEQFSVKWSDHDLKIDWPYRTTIELSQKDRFGITFKEYMEKITRDDS